MTEEGTSPPLDTAFARAHFPALAGPWALFENAGGTLAAAQVLDRIRTYMAEYQVQPGAAYPASARAAEMIAESHRAMAAMINAQPEEVMIGPSTSMNVFLLAQALRPGLREGDEIVVTNLDHEANVGAWRKLADSGVMVREWRFDQESFALEPEGLAALLSERTRLVCFGHCSNITGGFTDVPGLVRMIHDAGALACVDGVAYAPHRAIDVKAWDVDFYLCSTYKLYGPHLALLYGKRAHLERAAPLNHFFLDGELPLKLNPGGPNHELGAGLAGMTAYLDALHAHHEGETNLPLHGRLAAIFERIAVHEEALVAPLLDFLAAKPGVRLVGNPSADRHTRAPTVAFAVEGRDAGDIARAVARHEIGIGAGDFYAARCIEALGLAARGGVVRASMVHYNTADEVGRLIHALDEAIEAPPGS
ncbi:MAG: aminotransferase class V-fold PLP-dependent enzyme [Rhodospirillales bacterium]|nr:aminotransferase class V-fold PLP-dependent enzyme [Rhodospirillales bacterium]